MSEDINKDIKRIYNEDIQEKKRAGRGVHNRTGKQGRVGKVTTPADLLTGKEKKSYVQPSSVTTSNIYYDQIMSLEEFKKLPKNRKMLVLDAYKRKYTASELSNHWNLTVGGVHYYYRAYGATQRKRSKENGSHASQQSCQTEPTSSKTLSESSSAAQSESECSFMAVGEFDAESLCKKLQGLSYMLNDNLRYQVEIHVKEIPRLT